MEAGNALEVIYLPYTLLVWHVYGAQWAQHCWPPLVTLRNIPACYLLSAEVCHDAHASWRLSAGNSEAITGFQNELNQLRLLPQGSPVDVPLEGALALYGLNAAQVFREPVEDSKALIAWGPDMIVIAFRGTASFANVLNDIQVHVPMRSVVFNRLLSHGTPCSQRNTFAHMSCSLVRAASIRSWRPSGSQCLPRMYLGLASPTPAKERDAVQPHPADGAPWLPLLLAVQGIQPADY